MSQTLSSYKLEAKIDGVWWAVSEITAASHAEAFDAAMWLSSSPSLPDFYHKPFRLMPVGGGELVVVRDLVSRSRELSARFREASDRADELSRLAREIRAVLTGFLSETTAARSERERRKA